MRLSVLVVLALAACSNGITTTPSSDPVTAWHHYKEQTLDHLRQGDVGLAESAVKNMEKTAVDSIAKRQTSELRRVVDFFLGRASGEDVEVLLELYLDELMLSALSKLPPETQGGGYVHTRLTLNKLHTGKLLPREVRDLVLRIKNRKYRNALHRVVDRINRKNKGFRDRTLGLLLPLSGPYGRLGNDAYRTIGLAIGKQLKRGEIRLITKDTQGDHRNVVKLVDELVFEKGVVGILGPIGSFESTAAVQRAAELNVPIITLSRREALDSKIAHQVRVPGSQDGIALANYAMQKLKLKRFGLLIRNTGGNWAMAGGFWNTVVKAGGTVQTAIEIGRGDVSYRKIVQRLARESGKGGKIDGLVIADNFRSVRKLMPYFPYFGIRVRRMPGGPGVQLLGGSGWQHMGIIDPTQQLTDNAVFSGGFYPDPSNRLVRQFMARFKGRFHQKPSAFEAATFDAASLLSEALKKDTAGNRKGLMASLRKISPFQGVTGVLRFGASGQLLRDAHILTVFRDQIRARYSEAEERVVRTTP